MRREIANLTKLAGIPSKTQSEKIKINNCSARWVWADDAREDRVVLYLHGGGYNICSGHTHRELAAYISIASGAKVLLPDYRLAPEHPFPGALDDATSIYRWLLGHGLSGRDIALAGDSAGGGLAVAAAISLRDAGDSLPSSIVCLSPWTDLKMSGKSVSTHAQIDPMLNLASMQLMASNYIGENDPGNPLISPLYADMQRIPPLLIHVGSDEMLLDDATRLAAKAERAGVAVTLKIYDRMWHVWHLFAKLMPEAKQAVRELGGFIQKHFEN